MNVCMHGESEENCPLCQESMLGIAEILLDDNHPRRNVWMDEMKEVVSRVRRTGKTSGLHISVEADKRVANLVQFLVDGNIPGVSESLYELERYYQYAHSAPSTRSFSELMHVMRILYDRYIQLTPTTDRKLLVLKSAESSANF